MLKRKLTLQIVFILFSYLTFSQSKKLWTEIADEAFAKKDYANAAIFYEKVLDDTTVLRSYVLPYEPQLVNLNYKALFKVRESRVTKRKDSTNVIKEELVNSSKFDFIMYRLATSYRLNFDYKHAVEQYKKCIERKVYPDAPYYYGISLMSLKKYKEALSVFDEYIHPKAAVGANNEDKQASDSLIKLAAVKQKSCFFALDSVTGRKEIKIRMPDSLVFNRGTASFAPMFYENDTKVLFTSARRGGVVNDPEEQDSKYYCDVYTSTLEDSIWQRPINFGRPVNTSLHEGASCYSKDGVMLFTRWSDNNKNEAFIYMARSIDGKFYDAMKLGNNVNLPGYKSQQPYMTTDGKKLFFSSNRPGGKGGFDIWMAPIDENGFIGEAQNLKEPVNTSVDEITPFYHDLTSTLYYSTNGLPGLGGFDVHKIGFSIDDNVFQLPVNLNAPINSSKDDAYFVMDRLAAKGFFASDREDCPSGHCYDIYSFLNQPLAFNLSGYVFDTETNDPIPNALVTIKDVHDNDEPFFVVTNEKGFYKTPLKPNMEYFLKAQKNKYFGQTNEVATKGKTESENFERDFFLGKIPEGDIQIAGVEYDFNKATLRSKSMEILDKIVEIMKVNDNLSIELSSHTDARGNDDYNMKLSQARAQSCVDYILGKGIAKERVKATGYGETKPLILESVISKMIPKSEEFEAAHQKNRRTAFRVTGESNINIINKTK